MICSACRTENRRGARFCRGCGRELALACPDCGAPHEPDQAFCDACGRSLSTPGAVGTSPERDREHPRAAADEGSRELRQVSVLFVDLVGFTPLSEARDPEDVRELLDRYFVLARTVVGRHGGTIQKFIGDAVMAVWGFPRAQEDDAERAVRAALGLVEGVASLGNEAGAAGLMARGGIVTGRVASFADPADGLVVGDNVNTASRIQAAAEPGTVFVDETTRQLTEAGIAYEEAGEHELKGKAEPLRLHRAKRVIAGRAGSRRPPGLLTPLLGRDAELRLLKDLLHVSADRSSARLVSVIGPAGIGKTRLLAELANYVDGLAEVVLWHSGRCLSYGEGVAYSALAQMVRQRAAIPEEAPPAEADEKLRAALERWINEPEERAQLGEALAVLVGPGEAALDRQGLHAAWRLFFERLSGRHPVVLAFEDMQWADDGMLEFVGELVEFAGDRPIFVCALGREEADDRRQDWVGSLAAGTCIRLEPLEQDLIAALLRDLAPGLPGPATARIARRAEGVPLYAVEMVRTLAERGSLDLDRGLLRADDLDDLEVPASLNSLLESRLDRLGPDERELVKAMAVFGESFPRASAAALSDLDGTRVDEVLASLVRKGVLTIRSDPLSPERGQYKFSQAILRTVAYEMISKRERRPRHLAAAEHLASSFPNKGDEVAEQIATHLLAAYAVEPDEELRDRVLDALRRAARRALAVGAPEAAERSLQRAVELTDGNERGELLAAAGRAAELAGDHEAALSHLERARDVYLAAGEDAEADRLKGPISLALGRLGRHDESITRLRAVTDALEPGRIGIDGATLLCELGRSLLFAGHPDEASEEIERALAATEALDAPELMCRLLNLKGSLATDLCRYDEARALYNGAIEIGERFNVPTRASAHGNAADLAVKRDLPDAVAQCEAALATGRRIGSRAVETISLGNLMMAKLLTGEWEEVESLGRTALERFDPDRAEAEDIHFHLGLLAVRRGLLDEAHARLARVSAWESGEDPEAKQLHAGLDGLIALGEGRLERALELLSAATRQGLAGQGPSSDGTRLAWFDAISAALALGRPDEGAALVTLLEEQPVGLVPPLLRAELEHARALLGAADAETSFSAAVAALKRLGYPFCLARTEADFGAWLAERGRLDEAEALLAESERAMLGLGVAPALSGSAVTTRE